MAFNPINTIYTNVNYKIGVPEYAQYDQSSSYVTPNNINGIISAVDTNAIALSTLNTQTIKGITVNLKGQITPDGSTAGVKSLNDLTGQITLRSANNNLTIASDGNIIKFTASSGATQTSVNGYSGAVQIKAGTGISITNKASDKSIVISSTGITSTGGTLVNQQMPIGTIIWAAGQISDSYWHICDGTQFNTTTYSELYKILGTNKFPKLIDNRFIEGVETDPCVYKDAGLPYISGKWPQDSNAPKWNDGYITGTIGGAFYHKGVQKGTYAGNNYSGDGDGGARFYYFDASRCSDIYGKSETVQPKSMTAIPYIKCLSSTLDFACVKSLNGLLGDISLNGGTNITIQTGTKSLTFNGPNFVAGTNMEIIPNSDNTFTFNSTTSPGIGFPDFSTENNFTATITNRGSSLDIDTTWTAEENGWITYNLGSIENSPSYVELQINNKKIVYVPANDNPVFYSSGIFPIQKGSKFKCVCRCSSGGYLPVYEQYIFYPCK